VKIIVNLWAAAAAVDEEQGGSSCMMLLLLVGRWRKDVKDSWVDGGGGGRARVVYN